MERLRSLADGKTYFRLLDEINRVTLDIIAYVFIFVCLKFLLKN